MLASITPLGERSRRSRWGLTVTAYLLGSVLGGAGVGGAFGFVGSLIGRAWTPGPGGWLAGLALVCVAAAAFDLGVGGLRLPTVRRQVNENWLHAYRGWVYGLGFGIQLGAGVVTTVVTAAVYATFALALLSASPLVGTLLGATFGLVRAVPVLSARRVTNADRLRDAHRRSQHWAPSAQRLTVSVQVLAAVAALGAAVRGW